MTLNFFEQNLVTEVPNFEKLIGHLGDQILWKKAQGNKVTLNRLNSETPKSHYQDGKILLQALLIVWELGSPVIDVELTC